ncbi:MAG: TolC family protein [Gammaproteobacteria bacterium]
MLAGVNAVAQPSTDEQVAPERIVTVTEADLLAPLSLEVLVPFAVENNPNIGAVRSEWEASKERIRAQSWYENPTVTLIPDTGDMAETRAGPQGNSVEISQAIPFPGKLGLRSKIAESRSEANYQLLEAAIQEITRQVRARYADYNLAKRSLEINNDTTDLTRQFAEVAQARYRVGKAAQRDVILAQEQLSRLAAERVVYLGDVETAIGALNALLDRAPRAPLGPPTDLDAKPLKISLARLVDIADANRPSCFPRPTSLMRVISPNVWRGWVICLISSSAYSGLMCGAVQIQPSRVMATISGW